MAGQDNRELDALRRIAGTLTASGLHVAESTDPDGLPELTITNPADPARGQIHIGYEGYLVWEAWAGSNVTSAGEEIIGTVTAMLSPASRS
jgi:hypothetical protein